MAYIDFPDGLENQKKRKAFFAKLFGKKQLKSEP